MRGAHKRWQGMLNRDSAVRGMSLFSSKKQNNWNIIYCDVTPLEITEDGV